MGNSICVHLNEAASKCVLSRLDAGRRSRKRDTKHSACGPVDEGTKANRDGAHWGVVCVHVGASKRPEVASTLAGWPSGGVNGFARPSVCSGGDASEFSE